MEEKKESPSATDRDGGEMRAMVDAGCSLARSANQVCRRKEMINFANLLAIAHKVSTPPIFCWLDSSEGHVRTNLAGEML